MKNEDLTPQLSKMPYDQLMERIRAIRQARVTPSETAKPKKTPKKQRDAQEKLVDMLARMTPEEYTKFFEGKE